MLQYEEVLDAYGTVGRWFCKEIEGIKHWITINMGAQLYFKVQGTSQITLHFKLWNTPSSIAYQINDGPLNAIVVSEEIQIAQDLDPQKTYYVRVITEDIPETNDLWVKHEGVALREVKIDQGGILKGVRPIHDKSILFIGDSITAGIGARRDGRGQPYTGAASMNYAAICSKLLGYTDIRCAFGYTGIVNPGPIGIPACSGYINNICEAISDESQNPDIVVINHGTNDSLHNQSVKAFKEGYKALLVQLKSKYPEAIIFVMIPFGQYMAQAIREIVGGTEGIVLIETMDWQVTYVGDGVHVDLEGSETAGKQLAVAIGNVIQKRNK
ncbi:MAG: GDSL-type esterase/lipase family protein [Niameybacter sp.]|uniref:GDSL-type esterase/lipase family protein n=1 Tax=Niameybacter sp. TaxID=2033640 RepID=UPI002FC91FC5